MKSTTTVLASVGLSASIALAIVFLLTPWGGDEPLPSPRAAETPDGAAAVGPDQEAERLRALERRLREVERAAAAGKEAKGPSGSVAGPAPGSAVPPEEIRAAVETWLDRNPQGLAKGPSAAVAERLFHHLMDLGDEMWNAKQQDVWQREVEPGEMAQMADRLRSLAESRPDDANAQLAYGTALFQQLERNEGLEDAKNVQKRADAAFDRALAVDEHNWGARFAKAVAYTFWPDFTGKKANAIKQFEILAEQQEDLPRDPKYAQTYLYLGHLYAQNGDQAQAKRVLEHAEETYPDEQELAWGAPTWGTERAPLHAQGDPEEPPGPPTP